jgi:hypothetical protein
VARNQPVTHEPSERQREREDGEAGGAERLTGTPLRAQMDRDPLVCGAVQQERTERDPPEQREPPIPKRDRPAAPRTAIRPRAVFGPCAGDPVAPTRGSVPARLAHEREDRELAEDEADRGDDREVCGDREAGGRGGGPSERAGEHAERVAGVEAGQQWAAGAALELDALRVHRDVVDAGRERHQREGGHQPGETARQRDRDQRARIEREADPQRRPAPQPRRERAARRQPGDRAALEPQHRQPERAHRQLELVLDRRDPRRPRRGAGAGEQEHERRRGTGHATGLPAS